MKVEITTYCVMCSEKTKNSIELAEGWAHVVGAIDDEQDGLCPKHAAIKDFKDSQCSGCVGGWGECDLFRDFAYSGKVKMTDEDFERIESGICPRRTNGTFSISGRHLNEIDMSEKAPPEAGKLLVTAIKEYIETYKDS